MPVAVTGSLRSAVRFMRIVSGIVLATFLGLVLQPLAIAANTPPADSAPAGKLDASNEEKLSRHLESIEHKLERVEGKLGRREDTRQDEDDLRSLRRELDALDGEALKDFDKIERHIHDKKLPPSHPRPPRRSGEAV